MQTSCAHTGTDLLSDTLRAASLGLHEPRMTAWRRERAAVRDVRYYGYILRIRTRAA
jgi:hypothetical protein